MDNDRPSQADEPNRDGSLPSGLQTPEQLLEVARGLLEPPDDLPLWSAALAGLLLMLQALLSWLPDVKAIHQALEKSIDTVSAAAPPGQSALAMSRRVGRHPLLFAAIEVAHRADLGRRLNALTLALMGTWALRLLLEGRRPSTLAVARARAQVEADEAHLPPGSRGAAGQRTLRRNLNAVLESVRQQPARARSLGLVAPARPAAAPRGPVDLFNLKLAVRRAMLIRHARAQARAGGGGHGALGRNDLRRDGETILAGIRVRDPRAIMASLQIRTELDATLVGLLPVQLGAKPPEGALAWIDLPRGLYCARLAKVLKKGRRPRPGTAGLYEATVQVVELRLMPPLWDALRAAAASAPPVDHLPLQDLLGQAPHPPRQALAGDGPYRSTSRRFQNSICAHLLGLGHQRWPASLSTQQPAVVSGAREFYSACRTAAVDAADDDLHDLLGWPRPTHSQPGCLVGSFVTLKPASVQALLQALVDPADAGYSLQSLDDIVQTLNRHAAAVAAVLAHTLCLRKWVTYGLSPRQLAEQASVVFSEKHAHVDPEAAVPVVDLARRACAGWLALLDRCISALTALGSDEALGLAAALRLMRERTDGQDRVFTVGRDLMLRAVGHRTWVKRLPSALLVDGNVFRHYWPLHLADAGLPQLLVDVQMRHQLTGLHAGTPHCEGTALANRARLARALQRELDRLAIPLPAAFGEARP